MSKPANAVQTWFLKERGITPETLERCKVETTDTEARWKVGNRYKVRTGFGLGEKRKFFYDGPGDLSVWWLPVKSGNITDPVIITEGETDAKILWQKGAKDLYGQVGALPGCDAITPEVATRIAKRAEKTQLYFVLDNLTKENAPDYDPEDWKNKKNPIGTPDDSWKRIKALLPQARRLYLPDGYKDLCKYFEIYDIKDFDEFILKADPHYNFERLDLAVQGIAPEYLWQDVIPRAQFGVLQGESNVGKSLIYMAFAVALANREPHFLKKELKPTRDGRVLIVDEENPEAVIRERLHKLGLQPESQKKLFIISQRGVRLDLPASSGRLFEDVSNFNPDVVILDSFVRLHMEDENSSGAVSKMYNQGVLPISRDLGAAVLLVHHVSKTSSGDSMARTRGSTDITAGCDFAWDLVDRLDETPYKLFTRFKSRSGAVRKEIKFQIADTTEGGLDFPLMDNTRDVL